MDILYNVRVCGKRYKRKTKSQAIKLLFDNKHNIEQFSRQSYTDIVYELVSMSDTVTRFAFFDIFGKVIFSVNKVK